MALPLGNSFLCATSRARNRTEIGYISALKLDEDGAIVQQNFLQPTTSSGGAANSVSLSEFSEIFVALTDSAEGFAEIWWISDDASTVAMVAHMDIDYGGCCANAVWYS